MAYAVVSDAQDHIPTQLLTIGLASQPSSAQVTAWIDEYSDWVDTVLAWRYSVPILDAADIKVLKTIVGLMAASAAWNVLGGHDGQGPPNGPILWKRAMELLGWNPKTGQATLTLGHSLAALTPEDTSLIGSPSSTFTDPLGDRPNVRRSFTAAMEF